MSRQHRHGAGRRKGAPTRRPIADRVWLRQSLGWTREEIQAYYHAAAQRRPPADRPRY